MKSVVVLVGATLILSACASTTASRQYEKVTFEDFSRTLPYLNSPSDSDKEGAELAYLVSRFEPKNLGDLNREFEQWCKAQNGVSEADFSRSVRRVPYRQSLHGAIADINAKSGKPKFDSGLTCLDAGGSHMAGFVTRSRSASSTRPAPYTIVAFYMKEENWKLSNATLDLRREEAKVALARDEARNKCRAEKINSMRDNLRPGIITNYGMVIEVKPPLAQLQAHGPSGPTLQWVEISRLEPAPMLCN